MEGWQLHTSIFDTAKGSPEVKNVSERGGKAECVD